MNDKIKELWDKAVTLVEQEPDSDWSLDACKDKFTELILSDVLGCYHAIDNGNKVEDTEDFVKAVMKRYNLGKKK